jgi:hypothetical protein
MVPGEPKSNTKTPKKLQTYSLRQSRVRLNHSLSLWIVIGVMPQRERRETKMRASPDEYRRRADKCVRRAAQANDPSVQSAYEEVARSYRHLAAEIEMWEERKNGGRAWAAAELRAPNKT